MSRIISFFSGVIKEAKKTKWTSGKELAKYSGVVILLIVFFAGFFYILDVVFAFLRGLL